MKPASEDSSGNQPEIDDGDDHNDLQKLKGFFYDSAADEDDQRHEFVVIASSGF
ncbi:MAG: hypothetical protein IKD69_13560 [Solobacterium sp.]|nr:hypothetical protein [Solobacterium sp.]